MGSGTSGQAVAQQESPQHSASFSWRKRSTQHVLIFGLPGGLDSFIVTSLLILTIFFSVLVSVLA